MMLAGVLIEAWKVWLTGAAVVAAILAAVYSVFLRRR